MPTTLLLWRTKDDQFRVVQQGDVATLLTNSDYVLMAKKYKPILDRLSDQLTQRPVITVDHVRQLIWDNFIEIEIFNEINHEHFDQVDSSGLRIWKHSNENVFVSGDLKTEIERLSEQDLEFTLGFSNFAAQETGAANKAFNVVSKE